MLPEWIDSEVWDAFDEMRRKIRKPLTDYARKLIVRELAKFEARGMDSTAVLNQSILNCWQGIFELKSNGGNNGNGRHVTRAQERVSNTRASLIKACEQRQADRQTSRHGGDHDQSGNPNRRSRPLLDAGDEPLSD
jgi:hypothetical protein